MYVACRFTDISMMHLLLVVLLAAAVKTERSTRYLGCYEDNFKGVRLLRTRMNVVPLTNEACRGACAAHEFLYYGTEYAFECFCGNSIDKDYPKKPESECQMPCTGDRSEKCGGIWRISVSKTGYTGYLGCYEDKQVRLLGTFMKDLRPVTNEACRETCAAAHFLYSGTEHSHQCFCGNSTDKYPKKPESECNMKCSGDKAEDCGGFWRISVSKTGVRHN